MLAVINDGARAYKGVIPTDRWHEPYMAAEELRREMEDGVVFHAEERDGAICGVMGLQEVEDVTLVRHAYVGTAFQKQGIGTQLLEHLRELTTAPVLIGTWTEAIWAIRFYEKHGFRIVGEEEKTRLLHRYWKIPERQVETSVVLADQRWWQRAGKG
jgi:GNAT superfamily N-acetyltransferase